MINTDEGVGGIGDGGSGCVAPEDQQDFYFWLGEEGTAEEVSEGEFVERQDLLRANLENWISVRINPTKK